MENSKAMKEDTRKMENCKANNKWRRDVVVITTTQLHSTKPEFRTCAGPNPAHGVKAFRRSTTPQKQFIITSETNVFYRSYWK